MCSRDERILYADDTVLVYVGISLEKLTAHVSDRLRNISEWCKCNKFSLNPSNSEFMIVTNKTLNARPQLLIGSDLNEEVSTF